MRRKRELGYNVREQLQPNRLHRLDKIHISARLKDSLATAYTAFVAEAEQGVVVDLAPPIFVHRKCPLGFLQFTVALDTIRQKLSDIDTSVNCLLAEWSAAEKII